MFVVVHDVSGSGQLESGAAASLCLHHPFHRHGLSGSRFFFHHLFFFSSPSLGAAEKNELPAAVWARLGRHRICFMTSLPSNGAGVLCCSRGSSATLDPVCRICVVEMVPSSEAERSDIRNQLDGMKLASPDDQML